MKQLKEIFQPFGKVNQTMNYGITVSWIIVLGFLFQWLHSPIIPPPTEILNSFYNLIISGDFWDDLLSSFSLTCRAMIYSIIITMFLVYASRIPVFKVITQFISKSRYLTIAALIPVFTFLTRNLGQVEMTILVVGIVPYFTTSFLSIVDQGSVQLQLEKAYVNRNSRWQALYEIIIVGKLDELLEVMRQNFAFSWMMIVMVEGYNMSGGGIGTMMIKSNRHLLLADLFAMLLTILLIGIFFDWGLRKLRFTLFTYLKK